MKTVNELIEQSIIKGDRDCLLAATETSARYSKMIKDIYDVNVDILQHVKWIMNESINLLEVTGLSKYGIVDDELSVVYLVSMVVDKFCSNIDKECPQYKRPIMLVSSACDACTWKAHHDFEELVKDEYPDTTFEAVVNDPLFIKLREDIIFNVSHYATISAKNDQVKLK